MLLRRLLSVLLLSHLASSHMPPSSPCSQHFTYVREGNDYYYGTIILDRLDTAHTEIKVGFSQRDFTTSNYYGTITSYPDGEIEMSREPALFRVHFPNPLNPPKLTQLTVNGNELCSASGFPPPSTWFELSYTVDAYLDNQRPQLDKPLASTPPFPYKASHITTPVSTVSVTPTSKFSNIFLTGHTQQNASSDCGHEGTIARPFLHGGNELVRGQFPWMAAVYKKESIQSLMYICGGSLISARTVVSAAHCFQSINSTDVVIFLGRNNLQNFSEDGIETRNIECLIKHPDYNDLPDADIAVLRIAAISFTDFIRPICLWSESTQISHIVGLSGTVAGWGSNESGEFVSKTAKKFDVQIVSEVECIRSSPVFSQLVTNRTFCAGNRDGFGPCLGDSGSGLMLQRDSRWVLRGIVSFGQTKRGQCNLYEYVVYADVAQYLTWLRDNII